MRARALLDEVNLFLAVALVMSGVALVVGNTGWWFVAGQVLIIITTGVTLALQKMSEAEHRRLGEWQERHYVMNSLREAQRRGITPEEWTSSYIERVLNEARESGMLEVHLIEGQDE